MTTPEFIALVQAERERQIAKDRLSRFAARVRACCNPSLITRLLRALRGTPVAC